MDAGIKRTGRPAATPPRAARRILPVRTSFPVLLLLFLVALVPPSVSTAADFFDEYQVKAVFLYSLMNFVTWPEEAFPAPEEPISMCVLGEDPFGPVLDTVVQDETVRGRPISIRRDPSAQLFKGCHLLFINASMKNRLQRILTATRDMPMLIVGETSGFAEGGGTMALVRQGRRVRVVVNLDSCRQRGLLVSSKLLKLARIIGDKCDAESKR